MSFHFVFVFAVVFCHCCKKIANIFPLSQKLPLGHRDQRSISVSACPCLSNIATKVGENQMMDDVYMLKYASAFLMNYVHVIMHTQQHPASANLSFKVSKFLFKEAKDLISRSICLPLVCSCVKFTSGDLCQLVLQSLLNTSVKAFLFSEATKDLAPGSD